MTKRLSLIDTTFLRLETRETPMHVAGLMTFELPDDAGDRFVHDLVAAFRDVDELAEPFNLELAGGPINAIVPAWRRAEHVDLDHHIRHTVLPSPGTERELGELVSHLHSVLLDRSRPLWTCHVIEGLEGNRFAIYLKLHHAFTDGITGIRLLTQTLAEEPAGAWSPPWAASDSPEETLPVPRQFASPVETTASLARGMWGLARGHTGGRVQLPFRAPNSRLNRRVTGARRVATQQFDLDRIRRVAKASNTSVNDVFLAISGGALRRHLLAENALPTRDLVAGVPVSLRQKGESGGNQVGMVWSVLGCDTSDPKERLGKVSASMRASKNFLDSMTPGARKAATLMTMAPAIGVLMTGLGDRLPSPMNVTVSNVPGPASARYLAGARLEGVYPVSNTVQGQALNITCVTYDGALNVGFTGSRDSVPPLQRIALYAAEELDELERVVVG